MSQAQSNTLGKAGLILGTMSLFLVFSIGVCAGVGMKQGWLRIAGTPLFFILGASSALLGLLVAFLGFIGLFSRPRGAAIMGFLFGSAAVVIFLGILKAVQQVG